MNVACRITILDHHREVIHLYSLQYWAEDTALWESMGLKWNCSDNGWLLSTKDVCKGMILHSHTRISILFTILVNFSIELPVIIISISL